MVLVLDRDEWLFGWEQLKPLIAPSLPCAARVLDLGCGTSSLALDLALDLEDARVLAIDVAPGPLPHMLLYSFYSLYSFYPLCSLYSLYSLYSLTTHSTLSTHAAHATHATHAIQLLTLLIY